MGAEWRVKHVQTCKRGPPLAPADFVVVEWPSEVHGYRQNIVATIEGVFLKGKNVGVTFHLHKKGKVIFHFELWY